MPARLFPHHVALGAPCTLAQKPAPEHAALQGCLHSLHLLVVCATACQPLRGNRFLASQDRELTTVAIAERKSIALPISSWTCPDAGAGGVLSIFVRGLADSEGLQCRRPEAPPVLPPAGVPSSRAGSPSSWHHSMWNVIHACPHGLMIEKYQQMPPSARRGHAGNVKVVTRCARQKDEPPHFQEYGIARKNRHVDSNL